MIRHDIEQNTPEWNVLRSRMPTASEANRIITPGGEPSKSQDKLADEIGQAIYAGGPLDVWEGNRYTTYGHLVEEEARPAYSLLYDVDVMSCGFCTDDLGLFGCSPDGLVGDDGGLEIKCLPKEHLNALRYWKANKEAPTERKPQVQMSLLVTGREWWDLFFYRPRLPSLRIRCYPDEAYIQKLSVEITKVIAKAKKVAEFLRTY